MEGLTKPLPPDNIEPSRKGTRERKKMFLLIYDWIDENDGCRYEQWVESYNTKEELLAAHEVAREKWAKMVERGRLYLSPAINYTWAEIKQLF
jgi:hypothetical protein